MSLDIPSDWLMRQYISIARSGKAFSAAVADDTDTIDGALEYLRREQPE